MNKYNVDDLVAIRSFMKDEINCSRVLEVLQVKDSIKKEVTNGYVYVVGQRRESNQEYVREDSIVGKVVQPTE